MVKGIYHLGAGMIAQQRHLEVVANNLANANTVGFKEERVAFRNALNASSFSPNPVTVGEKFVAATQGVKNPFQQGTLEQTENPLDLAIVGDGYFAVETDGGLAYTRDGRFQLNQEGELVTLNGDHVLTAGGTVQIPQGNIRISSEGEIILADPESPREQVLDRLSLVTFENPGDLQAGGNGLLFTKQEPLQLDDVKLRVGYVEDSDVDMISQMVDMIQLNRMYDAASKAIQTQDSILGKAVNEVGRTR